MSADTYRDCPKCGEKDSVSIYYVWDFELLPDGKILNTLKGRCNKCNLEFK